MEYIEEVNYIPRGLVNTRYRFVYEVILRDFLQSKMKLAKVKKELVPYEDKDRTHPAEHLLVQGLKRTARRLNLPIIIVGRKGEVYLIREG